ncbi:peptide ABC transporter permease [Paenibacillus beijingensis]|uniref:Peptide ABC transporter permease n=1 Tax=Paenibacillus beijingensis TaxID=1126833 RepID=A0A0D5NRA8_9BACL|nr:peptide ABC transporter permease [Paenibacillus beijingensis]
MHEARGRHRRERRALLVRAVLHHKLAVAGLMLVVLVALLALLAPVLTAYNPLTVDVVNRLSPPSGKHLFGTDNFGRDIFARAAYGARLSLLVGLSVAVIAGAAGMLIGLAAAYFRRMDYLLMRLCDGLMAFPAILLAIAIMAALGPKIQNVIIALSIVYTPNVARAVRSTALVVKEQTFVEALGSLGAGHIRILLGNIAPNCLTPLIIQGTFIFADAIISEAALSFLGAGIPAPAASWGNILFDGKTYIYNGWWMVLFPGILLMLTVLGLNLSGDGLRDLLDPHSKK